MTGYIYKILGIETIKIYTSQFAIKKNKKRVYVMFKFREFKRRWMDKASKMPIHVRTSY